jgi:tRNA modification GTPase
LAKKNIAIVSDIPGTTRDVIEVRLNLNGNNVYLYDTAGLRETEDKIE